MDENALRNSARPELSVSEIIIDAFFTPWQNRARLMVAVSIPVALVIATYVIRSFTENELAGHALNLLSALFFVVIAVTCHRMIILGEHAVPRLAIFKVTKRELCFLVWEMVIGFICLFPVFIILLIVVKAHLFENVSRAFTILLLLGMYPLARLSLIFPRVTVDKNPTMKWAWKASRGNGLRLYLILLIPAIPSRFFSNLIPLEQTTIYGTVIFSALICFFYIFGVTALSLSYKHLIRDE